MTNNEIVLKYIDKSLNDKDMYKIKNELKLEEASSNLEKVFKEFDHKEGVLEFLKYSKNFPTYSTKNTMLLYSQNARLVKSFNEWKADGVYLKKGAQAVYIYAPYDFKSFRDENGIYKPSSKATLHEKELIKNNELSVTSKTCFKLVPVFDISNTNIAKEDYPKYLANNPVGVTKDKMENIKDLTKLLGVKIISDNTQSAGGWIDLKEKTICLNTMNSTEQNSKTILHELGHLVAQEQYNKSGINPNTDVKEMHAEGIAYLVADHLGIDTTESSINYLSSWSGGDISKFTKELDIIKRGAFFLNSKIDKMVERKEEIAIQQEKLKLINEEAKEQQQMVETEVSKEMGNDITPSR
jgi:Zn-dependent peptidase ImmA (M78 family)